MVEKINTMSPALSFKGGVSLICSKDKQALLLTCAFKYSLMFSGTHLIRQQAAVVSLIEAVGTIYTHYMLIYDL